MKRKTVAVTGGIGCGKSAVIKILKDAGYAVLDCDKLAREISERFETVEKVRNLLGDEFIVNGALNRKAIRDRVFADGIILKKYNAIFFDEVRKLLVERLENINGTAFVEISVFDAFPFCWDAVWLVEADLQTRIERTIKRDGASRETIENITTRQFICSDYTYKIVNDGNFDELKAQVTCALAELNKAIY